MENSKPNSENILFKAISILFLLCLNITHAQVGIGTTNPSLSSALDVSATNSGLLIPRINLSNITDTATITAPAVSLLVYNTGFAPNGYYYWSGAQWIQLTTGNNNWALTGNLGTNAGTNFIGTTDTQDIRFKTNSTDRWNISHTNSGQLQSYSLGTGALPAYSFQGDQNTGIFSSAADELNFSTAGTERIRIDATGNVGIGTTPTGSSILDMSSITNKAIEAPNVALSATNVATIATPATGALVYNTASASSGATAVYPGYYYWDGAAWNSMTTGGQSSTTYFSTGATAIGAFTGSTYIPGFPVTVTIPPNCYVLVAADIGMATNSLSATGYSATDIGITVNGVFPADSAVQRTVSMNNAAVTGVISYASMKQTFILAPGSHTFGIAAAGSAQGATAIVVGNTSSVLQGELTVTILKR